MMIRCGFVGSGLLLSAAFLFFSVSEKRVACIFGKMYSVGLGIFSNKAFCGFTENAHICKDMPCLRISEVYSISFIRTSGIQNFDICNIPSNNEHLVSILFYYSASRFEVQLNNVVGFF